MFVAIVQFADVPASCDAEFREWFAWSNHELRDAPGLTGRRLLVGADNTYVGLVEHESAETFAQMHSSPQAHDVQRRLSGLLAEAPHADTFEVVDDFVAVTANGSCCGGHQDAEPRGELVPAAKASCCS